MTTQLNKMVDLPPGIMRVVSGPHTGAESWLGAERVLIGNMESECDIVLDVASKDRHACLVRLSLDSWTVLAIAGDLWVNLAYVPAQHTHVLVAGDVLTLGRVAFCVANKTLDWSTIKPPYQLTKPGDAVATPHSALLPTRKDVVARWRVVRLIAGASIGALVITSATAWVKMSSLQHDKGEAVAVNRITAAKAIITAAGVGDEVQLERHPEQPNALIARGYVPRLAQIESVKTLLLPVGSNIDYRVEAIDSITKDLQQRIGGDKPIVFEYLGNGNFSTSASFSAADILDKKLRSVMQELPAVASIRLKLLDANPAGTPLGTPSVLQYSRSSVESGGLRVVGTLPQQGTAPAMDTLAIRDISTHGTRFVSMSNGQRYFVGATLPDGSLISAIQPGHVVLQRLGTSRRMSIDGEKVADCERGKC